VHAHICHTPPHHAVFNWTYVRLLLHLQLLNMDARVMCSKLMPDGSPALSDGSNEDCRGPYFSQVRWSVC